MKKARGFFFFKEKIEASNLQLIVSLEIIISTYNFKPRYMIDAVTLSTLALGKLGNLLSLKKKKKVRQPPKFYPIRFR